MVRRLIILCSCMIFMFMSSLAFAEDTGSTSGDSSSEDVVTVIKVKDKDTGEMKEVELSNGETAEGKIFIGVGKRKKNVTKAKEMAEYTYSADGEAVPGLSLVENMRQLIGKIPHYTSDGTNCVRTIGIACQGTPYGTETMYGVNGAYGKGGFKLGEGQAQEMVNTEQLIAVARDLGELIDSNNLEDTSAVQAYQPRPGDIAIVDPGDSSDHYQHAVMVKLNEDGSLGTISNGGSHNGVYEDERSPLQIYGNSIACYITSSKYASPGFSFSGGTSGSDSGMFEFVEQIGEALNKIILRFSEVSKKAYERVRPIAFELVALLAIIDLTITIMLAGMEISPTRLFVKVLKYGFIYWVIIWWPDIVDMFMQSMVVSANQTIIPDEFAKASENICQPHLMLQKVLFLLKPGFDYMKNMGWIDTIVATVTGQWALYLVAGIFTLVTLLVYFFYAAYICYVYISFFVFAALSPVTLPFMTNKFVKFFTEGAVGAVWTAAIRMMVLTFMIGMMTTLLTNGSFEALKTAAAPNGATSGILVSLSANIDVFKWYLQQCIFLIMYAFFSIRICDSLSSTLGKGRFEIGL